MASISCTWLDSVSLPARDSPIAGRRGSFWPSRTQELLLRSALAGPEEGLAAWHELPPGFRLQTLEPGTLSVLPLLYRALSQRSPEDPLLPGLKGTYRSVWVKNNLLIERLTEVVAALDGADVQTLLVGSLPAAVRYYAEVAVRPTAALEFLVEADDLPSAARALGRRGWRLTGPSRLGRDDPIAFADPQRQMCLLRVAPAVELPLGMATLSKASVAVQVGQREVQALSPGDDLLVACVSGARVRPVRSVDWLVDIAQILRTVPAEVDWQRLLWLVAEYGHTLRLRQTLAYLAAVADVHPPAHASEALAAVSVARRERVAYASAGTSLRGLGSFPQAVSDYLVVTRRGSWLTALATFPAYLRRRWGVDRAWQLPRARRSSRLLKRS